jgi:hypothetical protein
LKKEEKAVMAEKGKRRGRKGRKREGEAYHASRFVGALREFKAVPLQNHGKDHL